MRLLNSFLIAFAMYSRIPVPKAEWKKENMRYVMCAFPWVGAVIGALFFLWGMYGCRLPVGDLLYRGILILIPVIVTGGIHLDGLMDTADALSSWQPMERRLEILKDSHAGAFAILACVTYFFAYFCLVSELPRIYVPVCSLGFFLSRCLSGFGIATFPCARDSGLAASFSDSAHKKITRLVLAVQGLLCGGWMVFLAPAAGGAAVAASLLCFLYYYWMSKRKFGGITGDLAGWFLQICELCMMAAVVAVTVAQRICLGGIGRI